MERNALRNKLKINCPYTSVRARNKYEAIQYFHFSR